MAASVDTPRKLDGEKAQRIIGAMRASVARRGAAASTFDHVARDAGVSRGLLHYYFGSTERLFVEVVRHDCEAQIQAMDAALREAGSLDDVLAVLVGQLQEWVEDEPASSVVWEMVSASRHSEQIRMELGELYRRWRGYLAEALEGKQRDGVIELRAAPEAVAAVLFALGDGIGLQLGSDPDWDSAAALDAAVETVRPLLGG